MLFPENSLLFTPWTHPASGVQSLVLTTRIAPVQQSFYYTHPSFSNDGGYLWLRCGYPPQGGRHSIQVLGVADLGNNDVRVYPETQFPAESAMVDTTTNEVYWTNNLDVWKRGPQPSDQAVLVNRFPAELATGRLALIATHPTFSANRRSLNIDARFIQHDGTPICYIGELPLDGSAFILWQKIEGFYLDHGLFSPSDPELQIFAHEYWQDHGQHEPFDGQRPYHRIWKIRRGEKAEPLLCAPVSHSGHEWWSVDGRHLWYVHYGVGVKKVALDTREEFLVWPGHFAHAHSSMCGRYLVADRMNLPSPADCNVIFFDTVTGKSIEIVNRGPLAPHLTQCGHLHPHPQFCLKDRYICYTTTVHERVDVALVAVKDLINHTASTMPEP